MNPKLLTIKPRTHSECAHKITKMAVSVSRKKQRLSKKSQANQLAFFCSSFLEKCMLRLPATVFLLAFIYIWSSSMTLFSGNVVHLCVSSRKLNNLYCLSAGTQPNFEIPVSLLSNDTSSLVNVEEGITSVKEQVTDFNIKNSISLVSNQTSSVASTREEATDFDSKKISSILAVENSSKTGGNESIEAAFREVEEQLKTHRSWMTNQGSNTGRATCEGRGIYVYDLPPKFNVDLLAQCGEMMPWLDFCKSLTNEALGEPIESLGQGWAHTHQYALEPIFHSRVLKHPCKVLNQDQARLFYVPYYGGLDILRWHFKNVSNDVKDSLAMDLVRWLEMQGPWYRHLGKDHVFVLGKISWDFRRNEGGSSNWGTRLLELDEMQNPIKLLIERHPWHVNDIGIPHPTYFHPRTDDDVMAWQMRVVRSERRRLVSFAGAPRPDSPDSIRSVLIDQCTSSDDCSFLNCGSGECGRPESIIGLFLESEFCLQPPGDSPTRKSVFDSLLSGCIPVMFDPMTAYYQYPWHLPEGRDKYSVFIDKEEVKNKSVDVVERLMKISERERENMRRYIVYEVLPGVVYGDLDSKLDKFQDAFSISINNLLERVGRLNQL